MFQILHVSILIKGNLECHPTQKGMTDLQLQLTLLPKCTVNFHTIEAKNLFSFFCCEIQSLLRSESSWCILKVKNKNIHMTYDLINKKNNTRGRTCVKVNFPIFQHLTPLHTQLHTHSYKKTADSCSNCFFFAVMLLYSVQKNPQTPTTD